MFKMYHGWLCVDSYGFLCLSQFISGHRWHEAPTLVDMFDNLVSGQSACLRIYLFPHLDAKAYEGLVRIERPVWPQREWYQHLSVGRHDILAELGEHLGRYAVVMVSG
jgi:hypothetical protein